MSAARIDTERVIDDLRELARRTSDGRGAQRVCWGDRWREARTFLGELLDELGLEGETDEAGNLWARLPGADRDAPAVVMGSHVDSVPDGGWLDGALGVMAAVGVLRSHEGPPPCDLLLVDWTDEEGARFGRSLFGSSAFAGTLDPAVVAELTDPDGVTMREALAENGLDIELAPRAAIRQANLCAYLELHIEQGPRMEARGARAAAVSGCAGVERLVLTFRGQATHAGTTPMDMRRDAGLAAAATALAIERIPEREGGVATTGRLDMSPGIITAVSGEAALSVDLRHPEVVPLSRMLEAAEYAASSAATERGCQLDSQSVWRIDPIPFDPDLIEHAAAACEAVTGERLVLASGALHDAAEVARVIPATMVFAPSRGGISHAPEEDSDEADLAVAIEAYAALVARALA